MFEPDRGARWRNRSRSQETDRVCSQRLGVQTKNNKLKKKVPRVFVSLLTLPLEDDMKGAASGPECVGRPECDGWPSLSDSQSSLTVRAVPHRTITSRTCKGKCAPEATRFCLSNDTIIRGNGLAALEDSTEVISADCCSRHGRLPLYVSYPWNAGFRLTTGVGTFLDPCW